MSGLWPGADWGLLMGECADCRDYLEFGDRTAMGQWSRHFGTVVASSVAVEPVGQRLQVVGPKYLNVDI